EEAIRVARTGMQVFGGYGVVKDYDVERFLRDSLILPIYEGTSQIQSLMATKDLLKSVMGHPFSLPVPGGHSPWLSGSRFDGALGRHYRQGLRQFGAALGWLMLDLGRQLGPRRMAELVRGQAELGEGDLSYVLLSAERLTQMLAHPLRHGLRRRASAARRSTPPRSACLWKRAITRRRCRTSPPRSVCTRAACTTTSAARRTCWCRSSNAR